MRVAQAHGWEVTRDWYSGPATVSEIAYTVDGASGTLKLRGLPYAGGVILADPRHPERALCVSSYAHSVRPDENGDLRTSVPASVWTGIFFTIDVQLLLAALAVVLVRALWFG